MRPKTLGWLLMVGMILTSYPVLAQKAQHAEGAADGKSCPGPKFMAKHLEIWEQTVC